MPTLDPSFHAYHQWLSSEKHVDPKALYEPIRSFCGPGVPAELHQSTWCTEMAMRFLEEKREGPWLLSINPFDPHPPFDPPAEFLSRYEPDELPGPAFRDEDLERQKQFSNVCQHASNTCQQCVFVESAATHHFVPACQQLSCQHASNFRASMPASQQHCSGGSVSSIDIIIIIIRVPQFQMQIATQILVEPTSKR